MNALTHPAGVWTKVFVFLALYVLFYFTLAAISLVLSASSSREQLPHMRSPLQRVTCLLPLPLHGLCLPSLHIRHPLVSCIGRRLCSLYLPFFGSSKVSTVSLSAPVAVLLPSAMRSEPLSLVDEVCDDLAMIMDFALLRCI